MCEGKQIRDKDKHTGRLEIGNHVHTHTHTHKPSANLKNSL